MIIGFCGKAGSGKDTAANFLVNNYGFTKLSFATPVKEVAKIVFGLTHEELYNPELKEKVLDRYPYTSPRKIMQQIGTDMFRTLYPEVWIESLKARASLYENVVVADVRFENELRACDKVFRVVMPERKEINENQHLSETSLDGIILPELINNHNKLNDFYISIENEIKKLGVV